MRVFTGCLLATATLLGLSQTKPKETVVKEFYKSEAGSIRLLGVCSPDDGGFCWRANGKLNPALTRTFRKAYADSGVPFLYRKKTRIAIFDIAQTSKEPGVRFDPGARFIPYYLEWPESERSGYSIEPVPLHTDFDQKTTNWTFGLGRWGTASEVVPLRAGASTVYKGVRIKVAGSYSGGRDPWPRSTIVLVTTPPMAGSDFRWSLIDNQGKDIEVIDALGKKLTQESDKVPDQFYQPYFPFPGADRVYVMSSRGPIPEELTLQSRVDLSEIWGLRVTSLAHESITFKDIPLEPSK